MKLGFFAGAVLFATAGAGYAQTIEDGAKCTEVIGAMLNMPGKSAIRRTGEIGSYGSRIVHILNRYRVLKGEREVVPIDTVSIGDQLGMHCQTHPNETMLDAALGVYTNAELLEAGKQ